MENMVITCQRKLKNDWILQIVLYYIVYYVYSLAERQFLTEAAGSKTYKIKCYQKVIVFYVFI